MYIYIFLSHNRPVTGLPPFCLQACQTDWQVLVSVMPTTIVGRIGHACIAKNHFWIFAEEKFSLLLFGFQIAASAIFRCRFALVAFGSPPDLRMIVPDHPEGFYSLLQIAIRGAFSHWLDGPWMSWLRVGQYREIVSWDDSHTLRGSR